MKNGAVLAIFFLYTVNVASHVISLSGLRHTTKYLPSSASNAFTMVITIKPSVASSLYLELATIGCGSSGFSGLCLNQRIFGDGPST